MHVFPGLARVCRTTFTKQTGDLCWMNERLWQALLRQIHYDQQVVLVDTFALSFSARRPRPSGLGMNGALARRVLHCLHTAGPAGIYACGAGPTTKAPMNV